MNDLPQFRTRPRAGELLRLAAVAAIVAGLSAQSVPARSDWRRIGTTTIASGLASPASGGAVNRVAFASGGTLVAELPGGRLWQSTDGEKWSAAQELPPASPFTGSTARLPEPGARVVESARASGTLYAWGSQVWSSEDGGRSWRNLTQVRGGASGVTSLLGAAVNSLAADPDRPGRIAAATATGVWVSQDGGLSWQGWNDGLPAFRPKKILAAPARGRGVVVTLQDGAQRGVVEWAPGFRLGWLGADGIDPEWSLLGAFSAVLGARLTAAAESSGFSYAGSADGHVFSSDNGGANWRMGASPAGVTGGLGEVRRIVTDAQDGRFALAALAGIRGKGARVLRTVDGGSTWDDLTSDLPDGVVNGLTFDRSAGAVYAATERGVFVSTQGLRAPEPAGHWKAMSGLPEAPAMDVRLDEPGVRVLAAIDGFGVYETSAPHRTRVPLLLHAADYAQRAAAPGALLTVAGSGLERVTANEMPGVLLSSTSAEAQLQVPFETTGDTLRIVGTRSGAEPLSFGLPLRAASPAILVDGDGFPVVLDADSGLQVDALNPARPGARLQLLAAGLGKVQPAWPAGLAAPADHSPQVVVPVQVTLDGVQAKVARAILAPGYIGYYLVEFDAPEILNSGVSEVVLEAAGQASNRVRIYTDAR